MEKPIHPFETYLKVHSVDQLLLAVKAHVRYLTIWNAIRGNPITYEHARKIRQTVFSITGIPYTGPLAVIELEPIENMQTLPLKKINGR